MNNTKLFLSGFGSWIFKIKIPEDLMSSVDLLAHAGSFPLCLPMGEESTGASFLRARIPFVSALSSQPNYMTHVLPFHTIMLKVRGLTHRLVMR